MAGKSSRSYIPLYPVPPLPVEKVKPEDSIWFWPDIKIAKSDDDSDSVAESVDSFADPSDPKKIPQSKSSARNDQNRPLPKAQAQQGRRMNSQAASAPKKDKAQGVGCTSDNKKVRACCSFLQRSAALI